MDQRARELMEKRAANIAQARGIYETADSETREATTEEATRFDALMDEGAAWKAEADRRVALETAENELAETRGRQTETATAAEGGEAGGENVEVRTIDLRAGADGTARAIAVRMTPEVIAEMAAFRSYLVNGFGGLPGAERDLLENRALQADSGAAGGFLYAPEVFQAELIKAKDNLVFMRQIARVLPPLTSADSLGAPSLDTDPSDPAWTAELSIGAEDTTMAFGKRQLRPHPLAKYIKVSKTLVRKTAGSAEALVRDRLAYKQAVAEENGFLNGTGATQPLGVFTASDDGIGTGRDVATGNTTTSIMTDGLQEAVYSLTAAYRQGCVWVFHRSGVKQIAKLKDGEGRYLWERSIVAGQPDRLLTFPVYESEYAPSTFTTGLYVGILGNFAIGYWIVDALTAQIQVLLELYAAANQNGYIIRSESDGMPVDANAFARVTLA